ncbi:hypothetical protein BGZ61DRAFT_480485 [Ilyonectria robusta]|uniref:uncharacterized protein n=1 Tax=Ilyonectria robusta TaxID=1079257 RepID=UPI001E8E4040|nr:uncharacterized protein BGZ61DRAFT_480485 [Ilyonectria robusta]KAH8683433.1 hypothetical protein BGZ61DRAFT_480485 [Ilyonectria robusta]
MSMALAISYRRHGVPSSCEYCPALDFETVLGSSAGNVTWLQEPERTGLSSSFYHHTDLIVKCPGFFLQTPKDGDGPQVSFGASTESHLGSDCGRSFTGVLVSADPQMVRTLIDQWELPHLCQEWADSDLLLVMLPSRLLQVHIQNTSRTLSKLLKRVANVEAQILDHSTNQDFKAFIRELHACNSDLVKLERRWQFETKLSTTLADIIRHCKPANSSSCLERDVFQNVENFLIRLQRQSETSQYDLGVLPRRIENQFSAVYNLTAQHDTAATIKLARQSGEIAKAALRDSSSMKTIAVMTLVFLPATFICSFFSMSFFDWQADLEETVTIRVWIYFAVAVPLTFVVILCWLLYTRRNREKVDDLVNHSSTASRRSLSV